MKSILSISEVYSVEVYGQSDNYSLTISHFEIIYEKPWGHALNADYERQYNVKNFHLCISFWDLIN